MINVGDSNISVYIGDTELTVYAGDVQIYPMNLGTLTGITIDNLTWVTDVPYTGGTATSANCSFIVTAHYDSGKTKRVTNYATISGSLVVPATTSETREIIGTLTITATYEGFTDSDSVTAYQEAYKNCNPIIINNYVGQANNEGVSKSGFYIFDSGLTEITDCDYDFTGIVSICSRKDAFYTTPNAAFGFMLNGAHSGSLNTIEYVNISIPNVTNIKYPFGPDSTAQVSQTITSVTFNDTDNVRAIQQMFRYCTNLTNLKLGDLSRASSGEKGHFQGCENLTNVEIDALPNEDMSAGNSTTSWCWNVCTKLTEQSLINILNALPSGGNGKKIGIGSTNLAKLTSAAGQAAITNANNKGWTVN